MKLIVGLGNPGGKYQNTRHNFGFMALDCFQKENSFSAWENAEKFKAKISQGEINDEKTLLAKPQTFMNLSGQTVKILADFYKIAPDDILIVHDDIDLPLGVVRLSQNAGSAGHKGVKSIQESLGTQNFSRLRLGIKLDDIKSFWHLFKKSTPTEKFVLQNFSRAENLTVEKMIKKTAEAIHLFIEEKNISQT